MLTNNNKRGFVKLIALTLAALMVFAVCLTGCTDEDARKAAEDAQSTANAAQTAADAAMSEEEVAAAIAKALEGYLKAEGAVTDADVKKAIEDSLKNYQAKGDYATKGDVDKKQDKIDLSAYAKSADVKKVADDLAKHTKGAVTSAAVAEQIKKALAEYEIEKKIATAIDNIDTLSAEAIQAKISAAIAETLGNYYTKTETDAQIAAALESYFGKYTTDEVGDMLDAMAKSMNTDDWNDASLQVVATLKAAEALFNKLAINSYRQANKAKINDLMANIKVSEDVTIKTEIVVFPTRTEDAALADFKHEILHESGAIKTVTATNKILSQLTVHILRAPNIEYINAISANIAAANDVDNFRDEINDIKNRLYALGTGLNFAKIDSNRNNVDEDKYSDATTYHGTAFAKNAVKAVQVVTVADQAAFNKIKADLDDMIVAYAFEAMNFDEFHHFDWSDIKSKWVKAGANPIYQTAGYYKSEVWENVDLSKMNPATAADGSVAENRPSGYTFDGYYAGIDTAVPGLTPWSVTAVNTPGYSVVGYYDSLHFDPVIMVDLKVGSTDAYTTTGKLSEVLYDATTDYETGATSKEASLNVTYAAIIRMLEDAQTAVNKANTMFAGTDHTDPSFLMKIKHNHSIASNGTHTCTLLSDAEYVHTYLKDYMCEQTESDKMIVVPTAAAACDKGCTSNWTVDPWLSPVTTVSGTAKPWEAMVTNPQANTVEVFMNYALNINGLKDADTTSFSAIPKYQLYRELMGKAWELLYKKYQNYALEILQTMVNDYTIAANAAYEWTKTNNVNNYTAYTALNTSVANAMGLYNNGSIVPVWTDGFIDAFFTYTDGATEYEWKIGVGGVEKTIGPTHFYKGLSQYYVNNGAAYVPVVHQDPTTLVASVVIEPVYSDVLKAIASHVNTFGMNNNVYVELSTVSIDPRTAIIEDAVNYKESGKTEFEWKKDNIGRVQDAFDEELELAKKNLDEIINRYIFDDVKKAMLNDVYAYVDSSAAGVFAVPTKQGEKSSTYITYPQNVYAANGIANYFAQNTTKVFVDHNSTTNDPADLMVLETLEDILKKYVTGYNDCATLGNQKGYAEDPVKAGDKVVDINIIYLENNGSVAADLNDVEIQKNAEFKNLYELKYTATEKLAEVEGVVNTAVAELANEAVKYRFNDYLKDARDALLYAHMSYEAVADTYQKAYDLKTEYNIYLHNITRIEYMWNLGLDPDDKAGVHFDIFAGTLLGTAIAYDSPYYKLIKADASYASEAAKIASAEKLTNDLNTLTDLVTKTYKNNWNQAVSASDYKGTKIVFPVSINNGTVYMNTYNATGEAMKAFDKIINAKASSQDGKVNLY